MNVRTGALAVVLGLAASGCEPGPEVPPEARVTYDTVNGVEHVISGTRGAWSAAERWVAPADSGVVIGALDGPPEYTFGEVAGVTVGADGRIYVGDTQALEVRVYSPEGQFLRRFGRDGEGPGEFRNISGLARAPGGVGVLDGRLARVTVFDADGAVVRTVRIERPYLIFEHGAAMAFDDRGRYYDRTLIPAQQGLGGQIGVVTYGPDGAVLDSAVVGSQARDQVLVERDGRAIMSFPRPFSPRPWLALGTDGTIYFTEGDAYRIVQVSPADDTLRVIRRRLRPRPVTEADRDSARAIIEGRYRRAADMPAPPGIAIPDVKPVIADLTVDALGNLWVQSFPDPSWPRYEWWVHDPDGRYLGLVVTPRMDVMEVGSDYVAGVTTDELGVQRVLILPLLKDPARRK